MAGVYRPRNPERTVLYRVLFHHFERFLADLHPHLHFLVTEGEIPHIDDTRLAEIFAFLTVFTVVDRIINHLKLTFVANKPPPPQGAFQEYLLAADPPVEYFS